MRVKVEVPSSALAKNFWFKKSLIDALLTFFVETGYYKSGSGRKTNYDINAHPSKKFLFYFFQKVNGQ